MTRRPVKSSLVLTLLASLMVVISGCGGQSQQPTKAAQPAASEKAAEKPAEKPAQLKKATLRLDWVNSGYHAVWYYAQDKGIFAQEGIDLQVLEGKGSATVAQTVGNGSDNFGTSDAGTVMKLVSQGLPVKIVMGYLQQSPLAVIFPAKNGWKEPKDLIGHTVGVTAGDAPSAILPGMLKASGVDDSKVKIVNMDASAKPAAMLDGKVDSIASFNFLQAPIFESQGLQVKTLDYGKFGANVPGLALVASNDLIQKDPDLVKRFVKASQKALEAAKKDPDGAVDSFMKRAPSYNKSVAKKQLEISLTLLSTPNSQGKASGWIAAKDIETAQEILAKYNDLKPTKPADTYFTNQFVEAQ